MIKRRYSVTANQYKRERVKEVHRNTTSLQRAGIVAGFIALALANPMWFFFPDTFDPVKSYQGGHIERVALMRYDLCNFPNVIDNLASFKISCYKK